MTGEGITTSRTMTYERAAQVAWWLGWVLVCIGFGGGFFLIAYDWVLRP